MRVFQGVRSVEEIPVLAATGADEFYTAVSAPEWPGLRSHYEPEFGLQSRDALRRALDEVARVGSCLFLAMNEVHYGEQALPHYVEWMHEQAAMGVAGFIVSSVPLLRQAAASQLPAKLCVSTLQPVMNAAAAQLFKRLGASRIVFPEHVGAFEVSEALADPELKTEAFFWLSHDCTNVESCCLFHHEAGRYLRLAPARRFDFCRAQPALCEVRAVARPGAALSDGLPAEVVARSFAAARRYRMNGNGNLYDYHRLGLDYLKMGNRPMPLAEKLAALRAARRLLGLLEDPAMGRETFLEQARQAIDSELACCPGSQLAEVWRWHSR